MSNASRTTYGELANVLDKLPVLVREARRARNLSLRAAAAEMSSSSCSFNTVRRLEGGEVDCSVSTVTAVLRWLDSLPAPERVELCYPCFVGRCVVDGTEACNGCACKHSRESFAAEGDLQ